MVTREEIKGHWHELKGQLQEKWGQLTDNDLAEFNGNVEQLVGIIAQRTGAARSEINDFVNEFFSAGTTALEQVSESAREYAAAARDTVQRVSSDTSKAVRDGYAQASHAVQETMDHTVTRIRDRPVESLVVTFGVGLITGVVVSLLLGRRQGA